MALKTYLQKGLLCDKLSNKTYSVEVLNSETKELYNFYSDNSMVCSIYREYKKDYKVETLSYGDFSIFELYERFIASTKFLKTYTTKNEKELCLYGEVRFIDSTTVNPKGKKNPDKVAEEIIQRVKYIEDKKVDFFIESPNVKVEVSSVEFNFKTKIVPLANITYDEKSELIKVNNTCKVANIRSLDEISREQGKSLDWLNDKNYTVVQTMEQFNNIIEILRKYKKPIAVDTETTGLSINRLPVGHKGRDRLVGICISWEEDVGYYLPIAHLEFANLPETEVINKLRFILETKHIVTHFGIFDWKVIWTYGINMNILDDTYTLKFMTDPRGAKATKGLKDMTFKQFNVYQIGLTDFFPKKGRRKMPISFDMLPLSAVKAYGPADADFTLKLYNVLRPQLPETMDYIYGQEIILLRNIAYTEYYGLAVDVKALKEECDKTVIARDKTEQEIYKLASNALGLPSNIEFTSYKEHKNKKTDTVYELLKQGVGFNIASSKQVIELLYTRMGIEPIAFTTKDGVETTTPSTSMKVIKQYLDVKDKDGNCKYPIIEKIIAFKKAEKLVTAFFNKLYKDMVYLEENSPVAFIFPKYNPCGAESGRIAGYQPNLQQTAGSIRRLFVGDSDEYYIIDCDYSQIEYRVMATLAGEETLIKMFADGEVDFHTIMASRLFGVPQEEVTTDMRKQSKALNFGIPYGMGDFHLAASLFNSTSKEDIERARAKKIAYLTSVPKIRDFFTQTKDRVMLDGYVETMYHRRRYFEGVKSKDRKEIAKAKRQAGNTVIQGTAADIMKIAYNRVCYALNKKGFNDDHDKPLVRVAGSIHDELLMIVHKSISPWVVIKLMRLCMELSEEFKLPESAPLFIGASVGNSWADGKDATHELQIPLIDKKLEEMKTKGMHKEAMEDPEKEVYLEIYKFVNDGLRDFFDNHLQLDVTKPVNITYLTKLLSTYTESIKQEDGTFKDETVGKGILDTITSYHAVKLATDKKKFDVPKCINLCLQKVYGNVETYYDTENVEELMLEFNERFNEHEEFAELADDNDKILDEDIDGYGEEEVTIDYAALNRQAISKSNVKIKNIEFKNAREEYVKTNRIMAFNGKCYIDITGIPQSRLIALREYLDGATTERSTYEVFLVFNDTPIDVKKKLQFIDRDAIAQILETDKKYIGV